MEALMEELVEEILLRVPPDEPAHLICAAVVCKAWSRILFGSGFRRRYYRFHRKRPLLGYIHNDGCLGAGVEFLPTTSYCFPPPPPLAAVRSNLYGMALDCRHGRVLIDTSDCGGPPAGFIVWDPITGDQQHLGVPAQAQEKLCSNFTGTGAVLCAVDGCDHLGCHGGPFLVVFVGGTEGGEHDVTWASVYFSETGAWSAQTSSINSYVEAGEPSLLMGGALYFIADEMKILKYDLSRHGLSVINTPQVSYYSVPIDIDGRLGLAELYGNRIYTYTWSQQDGANGVGGWVRHDDAAELETLMPTRPHLRFPDMSCEDVIRFVEGTYTILFSLNNYMDGGVFTLDLKLRKVRKVSERWEYDILPYTCFYTPADPVKGKQLSPR